MATNKKSKPEPKISLHSPVSYLQQHQVWKKAQEKSDELFEQIARDSQ